MVNGLLAVSWSLEMISSLWIGIILADRVWSWAAPAEKTRSRVRFRLHWLAAIPSDFLRCTVPTVYRGVDLAPWITIILLVLLKTFVFRACSYGCLGL